MLKIWSLLSLKRKGQMEAAHCWPSAELIASALPLISVTTMRKHFPSLNLSCGLEKNRTKQFVLQIGKMRHRNLSNPPKPKWAGHKNVIPHSLSYSFFLLLLLFSPKVSPSIAVGVCCQLWTPLKIACAHEPVATSFEQRLGFKPLATLSDQCFLLTTDPFLH